MLITQSSKAKKKKMEKKRIKKQSYQFRNLDFQDYGCLDNLSEMMTFSTRRDLWLESWSLDSDVKGR